MENLLKFRAFYCGSYESCRGCNTSVASGQLVMVVMVQVSKSNFQFQGKIRLTKEATRNHFKGQKAIFLGPRKYLL